MVMGRIVKEVELGGKKLRALFDTGSERSYINRNALPGTAPCEKVPPFTVGLGGKEHTVDEVCVVVPQIENMGFDVKSHPLDKIGEIDGKEIDFLIGATTMEEWDIKLDSKKRELDLTGLKKREFTEF